MTKLKKMSIAVLVLAIGILFINHYLFSLPENSCLCFGSDQAEAECNSNCGVLGCLNVIRWWSSCDGQGYCETYWWFHCENGSQSQATTFVYCMECDMQ